MGLKLFQLIDAGTSKFNKRFDLLFKIYVLVTTVLISGNSIYIMIKYTLKLNGGLMNMNFLIHTMMQFLLIFRCGPRLSANEVICLLDPLNNEKCEKFIKRSVFTAVGIQSFTIISGLTYLFLVGPDELFMVSFGFEGKEITRSPEGTFVTFCSVLNVVHMFIATAIFSVRYLVFVYSMSLLARQNLTFIEGLLAKSKLINLNQIIFVRIEEMYLTFNSLGNRLNVTYGRVPLWFHMVLYAMITSVGTWSVLARGGANGMEAMYRNIIFLLTTLAVDLLAIELCRRSDTSMVTFQ